MFKNLKLNKAMKEELAAYENRLAGELQVNYNLREERARINKEVVELTHSLEESRQLNGYLKKENETLANENADVLTMNLELQDKNAELSSANNDKSAQVNSLTQDYADLEATRLLDYGKYQDLERRATALEKSLSRKKKSKR